MVKSISTPVPQTERVPIVPPPIELNSQEQASLLSSEEERISGAKAQTRSGRTRSSGFASSEFASSEFASSEFASSEFGPSEFDSSDFDSSDFEKPARRREVDPLDIVPIFHPVDGVEGRESISLMLLPVAPPNMKSLAPIYLEDLSELHRASPSPQRDELLIMTYERYLTLIPHNERVWRDFANVLIELKGPETASDKVKAGLALITDQTPLLIILTEISHRMCDYMTAAHYIERAAELQPHNVQVLTLLRDVQTENKLFKSASDTDNLIHALERGFRQPDPLAGDLI